MSWRMRLPVQAPRKQKPRTAGLFAIYLGGEGVCSKVVAIDLARTRLTASGHILCGLQRDNHLMTAHKFSSRFTH